MNVFIGTCYFQVVGEPIFITNCHELNCILPKIHMSKLSPQCDCVWRKEFQEIIKVNIMVGYKSYRTGGFRGISFSTLVHQEKTTCGHGEKAATYKPGREPSPETQLVGNLILDFPASRAVRKLLFKDLIW